MWRTPYNLSATLKTKASLLETLSHCDKLQGGKTQTIVTVKYLFQTHAPSAQKACNITQIISTRMAQFNTRSRWDLFIDYTVCMVKIHVTEFINESTQMEVILFFKACCTVQYSR